MCVCCLCYNDARARAQRFACYQLNLCIRCARASLCVRVLHRRRTCRLRAPRSAAVLSLCVHAMLANTRRYTRVRRRRRAVIDRVQQQQQYEIIQFTRARSQFGLPVCVFDCAQQRRRDGHEHEHTRRYHARTLTRLTFHMSCVAVCVCVFVWHFAKYSRASHEMPIKSGACKNAALQCCCTQHTQQLSQTIALLATAVAAVAARNLEYDSILCRTHDDVRNAHRARSK